MSSDGKKWIKTNPKYLMNHSGLKKRWKYQVITRMKQAHRKKSFRFAKKQSYFKKFYHFASMLNQLWKIIWYAYIGASLLDPRFSVQYIGRYTKRAVMAEYRIVHYDGKVVRFSYKDYANGAKKSYLTLKVNRFIGRLIRHIPDRNFPMIRYSGIFSNRWKGYYLSCARLALKESDGTNSESDSPKKPSKSQSYLPLWSERQKAYTGVNPLICPICQQELIFVGAFFGNWQELQLLFEAAGKSPVIPDVLLPP